MRTIKFRYWNGKKMSIPPQIGNPIESEFQARPGWPKQALMQWTGLLDRHGKDIFEGDIIKAFGRHIFKVIFLDGSFLLESKHQRRWLFNCVESLEVIGDIYQDSHLLEVKE